MEYHPPPSRDCLQEYQHNVSLLRAKMQHLQSKQQALLSDLLAIHRSCCQLREKLNRNPAA